MPAHVGFFAFCGDVTPGLYPPPCPKTGQVPKKCGSTRGWSLDKPAKPRFLHMKKMHYMGLKGIPLRKKFGLFSAGPPLSRGWFPGGGGPRWDPPHLRLNPLPSIHTTLRHPPPQGMMGTMVG